MKKHLISLMASLCFMTTMVTPSFAYYDSIDKYFGVTTEYELAAQENEFLTVSGSIQKALNSYPEINSKLHNFRAAKHDWKGAFAGYRPRLDLYYAIGRYSLDGGGYRYTMYNMLDHNYDGFSVILAQTIYDGQETKFRVAGNEGIMGTRYYELMTDMERTALLAFRAHHDVIKYRELVELAEANFSRHKALVEKVKQRTDSGLDSKISLRTAEGRLALAETNLLTQKANLHDVETQYIRIVGALPAKHLVEYHDCGLDSLPSTVEKGRAIALKNNYRLRGYYKNVEAMENMVGVAKSRLYPHAEVRGGINCNHNQDGSEGRKDKAFVEMVVRWNLYNGNRDKENIDRAVEKYYEAKQNFYKVERDITQAVLISFNKVDNINEELPRMKKHMENAKKTADAYKQQFEAGRRTLFDLLDMENEYFQASVAYTGALYNRKYAIADYLVATGAFTQKFDLNTDRLPTEEEAAIDVDDLVVDLEKFHNEQFMTSEEIDFENFDRGMTVYEENGKMFERGTIEREMDSIAERKAEAKKKAELDIAQKEIKTEDE